MTYTIKNTFIEDEQARALSPCARQARRTRSEGPVQSLPLLELIPGSDESDDCCTCTSPASTPTCVSRVTAKEVGCIGDGPVLPTHIPFTEDSARSRVTRLQNG